MTTLKLDEEAIFQIARQLAPAQREAYLQQVCDDPALRERVLALLRVHDDSQGFLRAPPAELAGTLDSPPVAETSGTRIGPYKLLEQLGEGGMGTVWMAEQCEPVKRLVALKIVKTGIDNAQVLTRFEAERQALALMDHPNIARVLGAGATDSGRPYFVMELVKGIAITRYCDERRLSPRERLALFIPVCHAVQHAHQKGIIHRDLKPSNVMIALYDGKPVPKVIDFGVAKATGQKLTEKTLYTGFGAIVGTLEYMSPEQAELNQLDIDTRSDIYSLGVLLYELLTGSTPLDRERTREVALLETLRMIREEDPPRPSARLSSSATLPALSAQRQMEPAKLSKLLRGELDWMVMKALEKDRERRYETANELAQDIERYLKDEPVQAGPPSPTYRLRKFVKRNKAPVLGAALVLVTLLAGIAGTTWGLVEAQDQSRAVTEQRDRANQQKADADQQRVAALNARNEAEKERKLAEEARNQKAAELSRVEGLLYDLQFREAYQHFQNHDLLRCRRALDECRPDLRGLEFGYLMRQLAQTDRTLRGPKGYPVLSGDGRRLFSFGLADGTIEIRDLEADKKLHTLPGPRDLLDLIVSRDGKRLFVSTGDSIKEWDVDAGKEIRTLRGHVRSMALSGDGKRLFAQDQGGTFKVWDLETEMGIRTMPEKWPGGVSLAVSGDGRRLFAGGFEGGIIKEWDVEANKEIRTLRGHAAGVRSLALSGDGKRLFSGSYGQLKEWDLETGKEIHDFRRHTNDVPTLALSGDGRRLFSGSVDRTIKIWDTFSGQEILTLRGHTRDVTGLGVSADGKRLVSASTDCTVKVWNLAGHPARSLPGLTGRVVSLALSGDGKGLFLGWGLDVKLVAGGRLFFPADGAVKLRDLQTGKETLILRGLTGDVRCLALSSDGKRLFAGGSYNQVGPGSADDVIKGWDLGSGQEVFTLRGHTASVLSVLPTRDGKRLVSSSGDGTIRVWDLATRQSNVHINRNPARDIFMGQLLPIALSSDGKRLFAGAGNDKDIQVRELETGKGILTLQGHTGSVLSLVLSSDGKRLFAGCAGGEIKAWNPETGNDLMTLRGHNGDVNSLVLSSNGKRLFSASDDNTIRVWDLVTGRELLSLPGHTYGVALLVLSADDQRLFSVGRDGGVKIWDLDAPR